MEIHVLQKHMVADLWLCTALCHNVFYQCIKFQVNSFNGLAAIIQTKTESEN